MAALSVVSHPYCRRCGSQVPGLFDPAIQYRDNIYHFSCAMRTILEVSRIPPSSPPSDKTDKTKE